MIRVPRALRTLPSALRTPSLRLRFAGLSALTTALVVGVVGAGLYAAFDRQLHNDLDTRLAETARAVRTTALQRPRLQAAGAEAAATRASVILSRVLRDRGPSFVVATDASGKAVVSSTDAPESGILLPARTAADALGGSEVLTDATSGGQRYRLDAFPAPQTVRPSAAVLVVGESLATIDDALTPLRWMLGVGFAVSLVLGAVAGGLAAGRALGPVRRLSAAADRVGSGPDLSVRLPLPASEDEVAHLTHAFNASLGRIEVAYRELEALVDRQRRFVADASHELRTPLTSMRTDIGMLLRYPHMAPAERDTLAARCHREVERMSRLAADLLDQARADARVVQLTDVDWHALARECAGEVSRLAAPRPVVAEVRPMRAGRTDADAVRRIARVLGENIARHTPESTPVRVGARVEGDAAVLVVEDSGPGVDPTTLSTIFDPFVRGNPTRTGPGAGLGLAIARALAVALGGAMWATRGPAGGLAVEVRLPLESVDEPSPGVSAPGPPEERHDGQPSPAPPAPPAPVPEAGGPLRPRP